MTSARGEMQRGWDELLGICRTVEPVAGTATRDHVAAARRALELVIEHEAEAGAALDDDDDRAQMRTNLLWLCKRAAAIAIATADSTAAQHFLDAAARFSDDEAQRELLRAAAASKEAFRVLIHAGCMMDSGDQRGAVAAWTTLSKTGPDEVLRRAATEALAAPRPIDTVPSLWRWNGIGGWLYGRRDQRRDGSYIATHCWSLLFVPLIPTAAYRVHHEGNDSYLFMTREPLSRFARIARAAVVAVLVTGIVIGAVAAYLHDPDRAAKQTVDRALAMEGHADPEATLRALDEALATVDLSRVGARPQRAGAAIVRLSAAYVATPFHRGAVEQAHRVTLRYRALPDEARGGVARDAMIAALEGWIAALTTADDLDARLFLLRDGHDVASTEAFAARVDAARRELASARAKDYPLEAVAVLASEPLDPALLELADPIIDELIAAPSLLDDAGDDIATWLAATPETDPRRAQVETARARGASARAEAAAEGLTTAQLEAMQTARPWDQRVALRLAELEVAAGKTAAAEQRLRALGEPGWVVRDATFLRAQIAVAEGQLEVADQLLSRLLTARLQRFLAARLALEEAYDTVNRRLDTRLKTDALPAGLRADLQGASEKVQQELINAWAEEERGKSELIGTALTAYQAYGDVVGFSLTLGTVKLRRAQTLAGDAREAMLGDAERAFLSIRLEAEGDPAFHLGLGEIYARLGKTAESDAELQSVLDRDDLALALEVARVYRAIGSTERAATIAEDVFATAGAPHRHQAAVLLSLIAATEDDRVHWLGEADPEDPFVRTSLLELDGHRALRQGKHAECERAFAGAAKAHLATAASDRLSSFNNAALAHQQRFFCEGDLSALADAEAALERAYRGQPDAPLLVGNLATMLATNAELRVIATRVDVRALRPTGLDVRALLGTLMIGPERASILAELAADPAIQRSAQLTEQEQVLSPNGTHGYERAFDQARRRRDPAAMAEALARMRAATNLDTTASAASHARWLAGDNDEEMREAFDSALARTATVVENERLDARTRAAAAMIASFSHAGRYTLDGDPADAARARTALLAAARLWPALEVSGTIAQVLLDEIGLTADRARWAKERRARSAPALLEQLARDGDPLADAIRASPLWPEVLAFATADPSPPDLDDWRLAQLLGDAALIERTRGVLEDPIVRMTTEAEAILRPGTANLADDQALLAAP